MDVAQAPIFIPEQSTVSGSQLTEFAGFCERRTGRSFPDHASFHDFSVKDYRRFWLLFLDWSGLRHEGSPQPVSTSDRCELASFPEREPQLRGEPAAERLTGSR